MTKKETVARRKPSLLELATDRGTDALHITGVGRITGEVPGHDQPVGPAELRGVRIGGVGPGTGAAHHAARLVLLGENAQRDRGTGLPEDPGDALQRSPSACGAVVERRVWILIGRAVSGAAGFFAHHNLHADR